MRTSWEWFKSGRVFSVRLYIIGVFLRLIPVFLAINLGIGLDDMFQYDMLARSLASGNGYRWYAEQDLPLITTFIHLDLTTGNYDPRGVLTSFRPPLYPAFLAMIYLIMGITFRRFFAARLVQAFIGAALVPLTYVLSHRLFPDREPVARKAAWVVALYPMLIIYPLSLATENLFFVLVLCTTLAFLKAAEKRTWTWFAASGILLGLTILTRSVLILFAVLAVLWVWFILRERKMALLVFACLFAVILPWMIRNTLLDHRLTGVESSLGYDLYVGYYPSGTGTFQYPQSLDLMPILDDGLRDKIGQAKAWGFITLNPGRVPYLILCRAGYFFGLEGRALTYLYSNNYFGYIPAPLLSVIAIVLLLPFVLLSTSAVLGFTSTGWRPETMLVTLLFIGYIIPHLLIIAEDRFHLTLIPLLAILASQCWAGGRSALKERWRTWGGRTAITLAILVVFLLLLNWGLELWRDADKIAQLLGPFGNQLYLSY